MPRNAGKATPKDLINKLAIEHEGVERVRAFITGISGQLKFFVECCTLVSPHLRRRNCRRLLLTAAHDHRANSRIPC
jgi:hypothetical protein